MTGDVVIDVPPESQVYRQVVRKEADAHPIEVDPVVRLYLVEVEQPELASSDERPHAPARGSRARVGADRPCLRPRGARHPASDAAHARRPAERRSVTRRGVARHRRGARRRHDHRHLAGLPRPRLRDRVRRRLDHGRRPPLRSLHRRGARLGRRDEPADPLRRGPDEPRLVRDDEPGLAEGADARGARLPRQADGRACDVEPASSATTCSRSRSSATRSCTTSCSGSTRPSSAARRSRSPSTRLLRLPAAELGLPVHPGARVYVLPCIAGHVGADTAGVILSEGPHLLDEVNLIVDVGTNAEIVLGNRERLLAASSPTGPAFEGAQISCGQRAAPGAIERVRIDPETLEPRVPRDRLRRLVGRARPSRGPASPASAARGSSRRSQSFTWPE